MRVLVVEDDPEVRILLQDALEDVGWDVVASRDGVSSLELLAETPVDLIIMDLGLPNLPGLALLRRVRELYPDIGVIVESAAGTPGDRVAGLLAGADDYLVKPFSIRELLARVAALTRRSTQGARARSRLQEVLTGLTSEIGDAVIITSPDLLVQSFNPAAEELYGFRSSEVIGRPASDVLRWVGQEDRLDAERSRLKTEGSWHGVGRQYRRDGEVVNVHASLNLISDDDGAGLGIVGVFRPIELGGLLDATPSTERARVAIREGLGSDEFVVHYQPIVRLDDRTTVGFEGLARWQHGDELRLPCEFIATAEQSDLILDIGETVLREACRQMARWRDEGHDWYLTVNLAARQLRNPSLIPMLREVLTSTGMPKRRLTLEVTETALIEDVNQAQRTLLAIADLGIGVSIDDFGTGWASLTYLQQFPVNCLKIDRSFVAGLGGDRRHAAIVRSIIGLGHELDLTVIAEGIETEQQFEQLVLLGCRFGQGFLFSPALPATELAPPHVDLGDD